MLICIAFSAFVVGAARRHPYDFAVAPDDDGVTGPGVILDRLSHSFFQRLPGFHTDEMDTLLQLAVFPHLLTDSVIWTNNS
jgi:hypothetical protein